MKEDNTVLQFKIMLCDIEPEIWRRIQVPIHYSFWDLHVAIQDSMGWYDCHLHEFILYKGDKKKEICIGIPDDLSEDTITGWEIPLSKYFVYGDEKIDYLYDFGDCWYHDIIFEGKHINHKNVMYPLCLGGERACPPEDCGGIGGYYSLLKILKAGRGKKYLEKKQWLQNHVINYYPYKPSKFDPKKVKFMNPDFRWKIAFGDDSKN